MGEICIVLRELAAVSILGTGNDLLVACNPLAFWDQRIVILIVMMVFVKHVHWAI